MKKRFYLFLFLLPCMTFLSCTKDLESDSGDDASKEETVVKGTSASVKVQEAGTLGALLSKYDMMGLQSLKISGPINGSDLLLLREMSGSDLYGKETAGKLEELDLSQASFVKGGSSHFMYEDEPCNLTEDNVIPRYGFGYCKLKTIRLPNDITAFGHQAFYHCDSLLSINIPTSLEKMGRSAFCYCSSLNTHIVFPEKLTQIDDYSFYQCLSLTSITLPKTIKSIGYASFYNCKKITNLGNDLPALDSIAERAFWGCRKLTQAYLPKKMTVVPYGAFCSCASLTSVDLSNKKEIDSYAFYACLSLKSLQLPDCLETVGDSSFCNAGLAQKMIFPKKMRYMGSGAFCSTNITGVEINSDIRTKEEDILAMVYYVSPFALCKKLTSVKVNEGCKILGISFNGCKSLVEVSLPESLDSLGYSYSTKPKDEYSLYWMEAIGDIFRNCTSLTSVSLPKRLKYIGNSVFSGCTGLVRISIPQTVDYIGLYAFKDCSSLSSVELPSSLATITQGLFENCTGLRSITLPNKITKIGYEAFKGSGIESLQLPDSVSEITWEAFSNCQSLKTINLPSALESLEENTFNECSALENVICPEGSLLKSIGPSCFYKCSSLKQFTVPPLVTKLCEYAFSISGIESISIPNSVVTIEDGCFSNCRRLNHVINHATTPQKILSSVFDGVSLSGVTLSVPSNTVDSYKKESVWADFGTIVPL